MCQTYRSHSDRSAQLTNQSHHSISVVTYFPSLSRKSQTAFLFYRGYILLSKKAFIFLKYQI